MRDHPDPDETPQVHAAAASTPPADGTVLVRIPVPGRTWLRLLPPVPAGWTLTVTLGTADLGPVPADDLVACGYRIAGVAPGDHPPGRIVDVLVPPEVRTAHPDWWASLRVLADRLFDLRMGPVQAVLAAELSLHRQAARFG